MNFIGKCTGEEEYEYIHLFFEAFVNNTSQTIKVRSIGDIGYDNKHSHGYYMVEFSSSPYTFQEHKPLMGKSLSMVNF